MTQKTEEIVGRLKNKLNTQSLPDSERELITAQIDFYLEADERLAALEPTEGE